MATDSPPPASTLWQYQSAGSATQGGEIIFFPWNLRQACDLLWPTNRSKQEACWPLAQGCLLSSCTGNIKPPCKWSQASFIGGVAPCMNKAVQVTVSRPPADLSCVCACAHTYVHTHTSEPQGISIKFCLPVEEPPSYTQPNLSFQDPEQLNYELSETSWVWKDLLHMTSWLEQCRNTDIYLTESSSSFISWYHDELKTWTVFKKLH